MSTGAERLGQNKNRRPPRAGGYANQPSAAEDDPTASQRQIEFINSLRERHGRPPLTADEATGLSSSQANSDIQAWKSMPLPAPDLDACPAGWDEDIWRLALLFERAARRDEIRLKAGRPVIYAGLADVVDRYKVRGQVYLQEVYGCHRREMPDDLAARCWYHWPPKRSRLAEQTARELTWVEFMEVVMAEFWSRIWDEYALDYFGQYFAEYANGAWKHWKSLRILKAIADQPKPPRQVMRRRANGATMAAASKEG